jgi:hypothetical protein
VGEVCIANISPRERQKRLTIAIAGFIVTLLALILLIAFDVDPAWRLILFFMAWGSAVSYFEARDKTCIALAMKKTRKMGEEEEKIEDADEMKQINRQSRKLILKAFYTALVFALIVFLIP